MAKWRKLVQGMPKPNAPITAICESGIGTTVLRGRLRRRQTRTGPVWWVETPWADVGMPWVDKINPRDEGVTWARGHSGPAVDRLRIVAALGRQQ